MKLGIWLMNLKKFAASNALRSCDKICVWFKVIKRDVFKHPKSFLKKIFFTFLVQIYFAKDNLIYYNYPK